MSSAICYNLDQSKILSSGDGLRIIVIADLYFQFQVCVTLNSRHVYRDPDLPIYTLTSHLENYVDLW